MGEPPLGLLAGRVHGSLRLPRRAPPGRGGGWSGMLRLIRVARAQGFAVCECLVALAVAVAEPNPPSGGDCAGRVTLGRRLVRPRPARGAPGACTPHGRVTSADKRRTSVCSRATSSRIGLSWYLIKLR